MPSPAATWGPPAPRWWQTQDADGRLAGGAVSALTGGFLLGLGLSGLDDNGGEGATGGLSYGVTFAGGASIASGLTLLGMHFVEGTDVPRRSSGQVAVGSALSIVGMSALGGATISLAHAHAAEDFSLINLLPFPAAVGLAGTGFSLWLSGARDLEGADGEIGSVRSPAMIVIGSAAGAGGVAAIAASFVVLGAEDEGFGGSDREVVAGIIGASGGALAAMGTTLIVFGASDVQLPTQYTPRVSIGPTGGTLRWTY